MADFLGLMKQASELKSKMEAMQAELDRIEVEGAAGGGLLTLKLSGKGEVRTAYVDDSLLKPDQKEILQDLIVAAHADARRKLETLLAERMQALTGGLQLPPGLKLFRPMPVIAAGPEIERLIQLLARLPGLGPRSARRAALFLIKKRELLMAPLAAALQTAIEKIEVCKTCGNIDTQNPCTVCTDPRRDPSAIVVVADVADLWALERAHAIHARYHVLGGTLSPLDGVGPDDLTIESLIKRAHDPAVSEIILALNATVDGQSTAHYITDLLHDANVKVTRLAHGVPVGGELDYLDEGTLAAAIRSRTPF
jgi:recombination protein RecR